MEVSIKVKTLAVAAAGCAVVVAAAAAAVGWEYGMRHGKRDGRRERKKKQKKNTAPQPGMSKMKMDRLKHNGKRSDGGGKAASNGGGLVLRSTTPEDWGDGADGVWPARLQRAETVLGCRSDKVILVLERCVDRQNAAAIYRTAESFGVQEVWEVVSPVTKRGGDSDSMSQNERNKKKKKKKTEMEMESNPDADAASMTDGGNGNAAKGAGPAAKAVKGRAQSSKGAEKWLTLRHFASTADCIKALREEQQCEVWATDLGPGAHCIHPLAGLADGGGSATTLGADGDGSDTPYEPLALPAGKRRLAIVMGRELDGVSEEMLGEADKRVYLPMVGFTESFNLSVATALVLQSLFSLCPGMRGNLDDASKMALRESWYPKMSERLKTEAAKARHAPFLTLAAKGVLPQVMPDLRRQDKQQQVMKRVAEKMKARDAAD